MRVRWTVPALAAVDKLWSGIAKEDVVAATRMTDAIDEKAGALRDFPAMGRPGRVAGTRELVITGTPYVVAYLIADAAVLVLHVQHGAQEWPEDFVGVPTGAARGAE
ncbi:MAG: type II toxin-antitoxin system RelE/ParE family toxin [Pseudomonadota bacterium]